MLHLRLKFAPVALATVVGALVLALSLASASAPSTADAASTGAYSVHWRKAFHKLSSKNGGFTAVSCAAVNLCVATDATGHVAWSTEPWKTSGKFWKVARIDGSGGGFTGISCPTKRFCAAVDESGHVTWTTSPTGGAKQWKKPVRIDSVRALGGGYAGLAGISCPSTKLCVAVDNAADGDVLVSTNPAGGARTWRRAAIAPGQQLTSVSCASTTLCVATGTETYYATRVGGYASDWHAAQRPPGGGVFSAISCAQKSSMCLAVGYDNTSTGFSSASYRAYAGGWVGHGIESYPPQATEGVIDSVSCPTRSFCVALDSGNTAYLTNSPVSGRWSAPQPTRSDSASIDAELSCTVKICVAVDSRGTITSAGVHS